MKVTRIDRRGGQISRRVVKKKEKKRKERKNGRTSGKNDSRGDIRETWERKSSQISRRRASQVPEVTLGVTLSG